MKYKEKLENFINDLDKQINFLGYMCCGTCARGRHQEKGYEKSFWISTDDLDNKASVGVDLILFNQILTKDLLKMISLTAQENDLSFYLSVFQDSGYSRMGVYSKRGKQEKKLYVDGVEQK